MEELPTSRGVAEHPPAIPTGSQALDACLGTGGIPAGCIVEISGPICSGKSTLCRQIMAGAQRQGGLCALIDTDQSWTPGLARLSGVDLARLVVCTLPDLASALDALTILARSGAMSVIVLDSIHPFQPLVDRPGPQVRDTGSLELLVAKTLRQISSVIKNSPTVVLITSLTMPRQHAVYHALAHSTSRLALKMHASIRIQLAELNQRGLPENEKFPNLTGRIIKNSFNTCQQFAEVDIM